MKVLAFFQKVEGQFVRVTLSSLADTLADGLRDVTCNQIVLQADCDMAAGSVLEIPSGAYDRTKDFFMLNYEGMLMIPNYQYQELDNTHFILGFDVPENGVLHAIILKVSGKTLGV